MRENTNAENYAFIAGVFLSATEGREEITENEAATIIADWKRDGVDVPPTLTPHTLHIMWNHMCSE